jgi:uncharacterized 2Fe-2S/4Fe-4S cluster protein (DUF4445 family)
LGKAVILPAVSAYIGSDTVAAVLTSEMHRKDNISLLIDIGTNGEIVLGGKNGMYSCSAAAGPAFEGALIRNGVSGIKGAIDRVRLLPDFNISTIAGEKPLGICGSGIVDAVAEMLKAGVIDESGRFAADNSGLPSHLKSRIFEVDGQKGLLLASRSESSVNTDICVTQKDVRELQNAKGAIAAGIKLLVSRLGISLFDISKVYLAGGFGSYINKDSAIAIGLLPAELNGKIESIGNAAGIGAVESLLSAKMLDETEKIKSKIKYVELSSAEDFMDEYIDNMALKKI